MLSQKRSVRPEQREAAVTGIVDPDSSVAPVSEPGRLYDLAGAATLPRDLLDELAVGVECTKCLGSVLEHVDAAVSARRDTTQITERRRIGLRCANAKLFDERPLRLCERRSRNDCESDTRRKPRGEQRTVSDPRC